MVVRSDELYHTRSHKYLKREWKNGGWQYTYYKPADRFHSYDRYERYTGKLVQTKSKDGTILTERVKPSSEKNQKLSYYSRAMKAKQDYGNAKSAGPYFNETGKEHQARIKSTGRNYAALMQETNRVEKEVESKKLKNIAKKTIKSISTAVNGAYDKGKKWLSSIITSETRLSHEPIGKLNVVKGANGNLTVVGVTHYKRK